MTTEDLKGLRKFWVMMYWVSLVTCGLTAILLIVPPLTKMELFAAGCNVFNLFASDWWIKFIDKEMGEQDK